MWIKYLKDTKTNKTGETVEATDAKTAQVLVDAGIAELAEAPASVAALASDIKGELASFVKATAAEVVKELKTEVKGIARPIAMPEGYELGSAQPWRVPAEVKRYGSLKNFKGEKNGRGAEQRAYEFGMWMLGMLGHENALKFCDSHGYKFIEDGVVRGKVQRENNNISSGFLVPDQFENDLIDLREYYGVFRQYAKIVPMASDTRSDPRRTGGLTVYVVGESTAPTASDKTWDRVRLTAKKIGVLTKYTKELGEDAVINVGDDLAGEIAYAFAAFEDDCGFNGDGTSAYAGITGVRTAMYNVASNAGVVAQGTSNTWSAQVLSDFNNVLGLLPQYAFKAGDVAWYCSQAYWGSVMQRLATAAGGNRVADIVDGVPQPSFLGYPVRISQKMPTTTATGTIPVLFGNLRLACSFGDRRRTSIRMSDVALNSFEQDEMAIVGFERFDIVAHDVGSSTQAGPIVGLKTS